ncbi:hypothetical protein AX17_001530 [Amanita inopinata Kibby_2008]|nr:hypothetical protein AX17_001530 [Amanita inopinata Kibby_2008]
MDFMTLLIFSHARLLRAATMEECGWSASQGFKGDGGDLSGVDVLNGHALFKHLTPPLTQFSSRASPSWHARFAQSAQSYNRAHRLSLSLSPSRDQFGEIQSSQSSQSQPHPQAHQTTIMDTFYSLRRDTSGARMVFDLVEIALGHRPATGHDTLSDDEDQDEDDNANTNDDDDDKDKDQIAAVARLLDELRNLAADIVALSMDIVSYNQFQSSHQPPPSPPSSPTLRPHQKLPHNAVAVCMMVKNLSAQGAINFTVKLVKEKVESFLDTEQALQNMHPSRSSLNSNLENYTYSWLRSSLHSTAAFVLGPLASHSSESQTNAPASSPAREILSELVLNAAAYTQLLRDYISGTIYWFYETELYFGTKGEEVKAFGWVFLSPPASNSPIEKT